MGPTQVGLLAPRSLLYSVVCPAGRPENFIEYSVWSSEQPFGPLINRGENLFTKEIWILTFFENVSFLKQVLIE